MYAIRLRRQNHSIRLNKSTTPINIRKVNSSIRLKHTGQRGLPGLPGVMGPPGPTGLQGVPGVGIPTGGSTQQVLAKASEQDYDTQWISADSTDKTYTTSFTVATEVIVTHNMNKYPSVTIIDSAEEEVEGEVDYINTNQLIVYFALPFSGKVICN